MINFSKLFSSFSKIKVLIVGDLMLDTYWWGNVDRISPEAPVPVVAMSKKELRVGGAANVALNTVSLGADTTVISIIGNDQEGSDLKNLLNNFQINTAYIITSDNRITTNKTRIMSRHQQMMRLDTEQTNDIDTESENLLINKVTNFFEHSKPDVVIFQDYNKGILTKRIITELIDLCNKNQVITSVDPKQKNFLAYQGVTIFKPNLKEVKEGLHRTTETINLSSLQEIHVQLVQHLQHKISLITLSEKGVFYQEGEIEKLIPTHVRKIADVSGAGDTVIAVASLVYAATKDFSLAAEMANIAGGLVCEEVGTVAIDKEKFLSECGLLLGGSLE